MQPAQDHYHRSTPVHLQTVCAISDRSSRGESSGSTLKAQGNSADRSIWPGSYRRMAKNQDLDRVRSRSCVNHKAPSYIDRIRIYRFKSGTAAATTMIATTPRAMPTIFHTISSPRFKGFPPKKLRLLHEYTPQDFPTFRQLG